MYNLMFTYVGRLSHAAMKFEPSHVFLFWSIPNASASIVPRHHSLPKSHFCFFFYRSFLESIWQEDLVFLVVFVFGTVLGRLFFFNLSVYHMMRGMFEFVWAQVVVQFGILMDVIFVSYCSC